MVNFVMLRKPHVVPPVPERFWAPGHRTHCVTGESWDVGCQFEVVDGVHGKVLRMVEGGVTGYESFYIEERHLNPEEWKDGWTANAGTPRFWDTLHISRENMLAVMEWAKGKL